MPDPKLTEDQQQEIEEANYAAECRGLGPGHPVLEVVARMVAAADQTARAEERERIADEIAGSYPLNGELRHDGSADPLAAAYVEGLHDAWAIVRSTR